jgi:hypothetical protein
MRIKKLWFWVYVFIILVLSGLLLRFYLNYDPEDYEEDFNDNNNNSMNNNDIIGTHIAIGGTVFNCEPYIDAVFKNMKKIGQLYQKCSIVIAIDQGTDQSLEKLKKWQKRFSGKPFHLYISEGTKTGSFRTENLSNARNRILNTMREIQKTDPFEHFIIMDCDDVCAQPIQLDVIKNAFKRKEEWDSVSFIGSPDPGRPYYDFWALSIRPYMLSFLHYEDLNKSMGKMEQFIRQEIQKNEWIPCYSAFNALAIYRSYFLKYNYHWKIEDIIALVPEYLQKESKDAIDSPFQPEKYRDDCEHRYFHFLATLKERARMFIIPEYPFINQK